MQFIVFVTLKKVHTQCTYKKTISILYKSLFYKLLFTLLIYWFSLIKLIINTDVLILFFFFFTDQEEQGEYRSFKRFLQTQKDRQQQKYDTKMEISQNKEDNTKQNKEDNT